MTIGSKSNEPKKLSNNTKILNKQKKSQIISIVAKLKIFKWEPNKTYKK
jgi:hypothetical protein